MPLPAIDPVARIRVHRDRSTSVLLATVLAIVLSACTETPGVACLDGSVCAEGLVCDDVHDRCVRPEQLEACVGVADETPCDIGGRRVGLCRDEVCVRPICGDGMVDGSEDCDGDNLGTARDCAALGFHEPGRLTCNDDCTYDLDACAGRCGDGIVQPGHEECDGGDLASASCETLGFHGGALACDANCRFNKIGCDGRCGDGSVTAGEACDGNDFGGTGCTDLGFYTGRLACSDDCSAIDTSGCVGACGDGVRNGNERCDGGELGGIACENLGWQGGDLSCRPDCSGVDTAGCTGFCGDGVVNGNERCDGLDQREQSCRTFTARGGALGCSAFCQPTFDRCYWGAWRPFSVDGADGVTSLWGSGSDDVWAVGPRGLLLRFARGRWRAVDIGARGDLTRVSGTAADDVWVVADHEIHHFDGSRWEALAFDPLDTVHAVAGRWPDDVWAVSDFGVSHYDGTWRAVDAGIAEPAAAWSHGGQVWIAGGDTVAHWNGLVWQRHSFPGTVLHGLWGTSTDDVWAYGNTALHFDGLTWKETRGRNRVLGLLWTYGTSVFAFDGRMLMFYDGVNWYGITSPSDVQAAWGTALTDLWTANPIGFMHYDGPGWFTGATFDGALTSVWARRPNDAWAVSGTRIVHNQGITNQVFDVTDRTLHDIWGTRREVWAVGDGGTVLRMVGGAWSQVPAPGDTSLRAIHGTDPDDVWVVGTDLVARWDGVAWKRIDGAGGAWVDVWATAPDDVWILRVDGAIGHVDGSGALRVVESDPRAFEMTALWASGPHDVWAVGSQGRIVHHDGVTTTIVESSTTRRLEGVWGSGPADVWAVGEGEHVRFDGLQWATVPSSPSQARRGVSGSGPDDVWAVTDDGDFTRLTHRMPALPGEACERPLPIYCQSIATGSVAGAKANRDRYGCGARPELGGEVVYRLESPVTGRVTARLVPRGADLDLIAVAATDRDDCDLDSCLGSGQIEGDGAEEVVLDTVQGETLYFVVDSPSPSSHGYALEIRCDKH